MSVYVDMINSIWARLHAFWRSDSLVKAYAGLILLGGFIYQLSYPIILGDTDMWYHLSDGRFFLEHGYYPDSSYFSFVSPPLNLDANWWLFQPLLAIIYKYTGYYGLIWLRALLFLGSTFFLFRIVTHRSRDASARVPSLCIFAILFAILELRSYQVRPHLFSYFFILSFLYILEVRPRYVSWLPVLTVLWVNLHAVEWVVAALICGSYFIEYVFGSPAQGPLMSRLKTRYTLSLVLCAPAVLANPTGFHVLTLPWHIVPDISLFIQEMHKVPMVVLSWVRLDFLSPKDITPISLMALALVLSFLLLGAKRRLRIAHVLLSVGGALLLAKAARFISEWACLSAPIVARAALVTSSEPRRRATLGTLMVWAVAGILLLSPLHLLATKRSHYSDYPIDTEGLPVGIVAFLKEVNAKGNLFASPSPGGYLQWVLAPQIKIFSDMRMNSLNFAAAAPYISSAAMEKLLARYKVSYFAVALSLRSFEPAMSRFDQFVPVFYDDSYVLYANKDLVPEIAKRYRISAMTPYNLLGGSGTADQRLAELKRADGIFGRSRRTLLALTYVLFKEKRYAEAEPYAKRLVALFPLDPSANFMLGDVLENMNRFNEAIAYYRRSLDGAPAEYRRVVYARMGSCFYLTKHFDEAYAAFRQALNPYVRSEALEDLYQYAYSAVVVGDLGLAERTLQQLLTIAPKDAGKILKDARGLLEQIRSGELSNPSPMDWIRHLIRGRTDNVG